MKTLIKNGRIITAVDDYIADILIEDETVSLIGKNLDMPVDKTIDATGKYVMPGGIDAHTHMELPFGGTFSSDDFETGTIAAAHGGTTTLVDFAVQFKGEAMQTAMENWLKKAEGKAAIDYAFHLILTELPDDKLTDMDEMVREGVSSFKLFMAYPGVFLSDDDTIFKALKRTSENGAIICMHAENGRAIDLLVQRALAEGNKAPKYHALTRPHQMEAEATSRAIALAEIAGVPIYIVHLSSHLALEAVQEARDKGLPVYAETCPQYLFLSLEDYTDTGFDGAKYICSPPIRERANQDYLWKGLMSGDLQAVSTDHCPFCMKEGYKGLPKQKELGMDSFAKIPNGLPGVENRLHLIWDGGVNKGRISPNKFVDLVSTTPAKIFGLFPRKGTIAVGSDADIIIWDPNKEMILSAETHHMRVDYNPYEGKKIKGIPVTVMSRGRVLVENNQFLGKAGSGQYIKRALFNMPLS